MQPKLNLLFEPVRQWEDLKRLVGSIKNKGKTTVTGLSESRKVHFACLLARETGKKILYVAPNEYAALRAYEDFSFFSPDKVVLFEPNEYMLYDVEARSTDVGIRRMSALEEIVKGEWEAVVVSVNALMQWMPSPKDFINSFLYIKQDDVFETTELAEMLVQRGYERVSQVLSRGQFSLRGDILDIFPATSEQAYRIEFFDNIIDQIRMMNVNTQRSGDTVGSVKILPARENLVFDAYHEIKVLDKIQRSLERLTASLKERGKTGQARKIELNVKSDMEKLASRGTFPGYDRYIPFILGNEFTLLDYMEDVLVFMDDPDRMEATVNTVIEDHARICDSISEKKGLLSETYGMHMDFPTLDRMTGKFPKVELVATDKADFSVPSKQVLSFVRNPSLFLEQIHTWIDNDYLVVILVGSESKVRRMAEMLAEDGIDPSRVNIMVGGLQSGFEYPDFRFAVVSDSSLLKGRAAKRRASHKDGKPITSFAEIKPGDYVVHDTYGIGIFTGLETIEIDNVKRDYIRIKYAGSDSLFIPTDQLSAIQKYIGPEAGSLRLNKLGGSEWKKTTGKVKESLRIYAKELVELYAKRANTKGYAFSKDTVWQKEFEDSFIYEETEDQLKCVEEIKADMEKPIPMERLLCGDVGYGKTEVALRAAFKAICDGKQVAFLVPTTVLAQQHYKNFVERFKDFPVKVEHLSRFRTSAERNRILRELKKGSIDLLVGTHSIIQRNIEFKDLGLLIIDEEQRFGVMHKEKLKQDWPGVDILSLSATPIPRTLHMSLSGIRDISIIQDPPEARYPVQTYVIEWEEPVIRNAIYREMSRKGQIFYLYNRVRGIEEKRRQLSELVPEARIVVAHGQMSERVLEETMLAFGRGDYDILLCTTIIESGLDMPNVNTVIVEDGDRLGLAQLYQIRGRVGRSDRLAYAYITYKKDKELNEIAERRLRTIREFTEFGSGFKIALRDLEIRGAGSVLGEKQHGQLAAVGYDMYCKLLAEVVQEERGIEPSEIKEEISAKVEFQVDAYIDSSYIEDEEARLVMYKKIAGIQSREDIGEIVDELIDRFGDVPESVYNLVQISYIRYLAGKCKFASVICKNTHVAFVDANNKTAFTLPAKNKKPEVLLKKTVDVLEGMVGIR